MLEAGRSARPGDAILNVVKPRVARILLLVLIIPASIALAAEDPLLDILAQELERNFQVLRAKADPAPYFVSCAVTDTEYALVSATRGVLEANSGRRSRLLDVTVRVGSPELDNYHPVAGETAFFASARPIPLEDEPDAIRRALWLEIDRVYRAAAERLIRIKTQHQVAVSEPEAPPDFSLEEPVRYAETVPPLAFAAGEWAARVRKLSRELATFPDLLSSRVSVVAQREVKYLVTTEGTRLAHGRRMARLEISATAKADDGMDLANSESFESLDDHPLPDDETILEAVRRVGSVLARLRQAPLVEPYVGPAILSGKAAGVFFHEIFGHRIEGHRQKDVTEGQTFAKSVGTRVLPEFLSVIFDPTVRRAAGVDLFGAYRFDDEGVPARRVPVVENGIMKTFLMSRSPIRGFSRSNGHGRRQPGMEVVSRQSNLIVESAQQVPPERLRQMLIEEIQRQGKPYGYYFEHVTGGYTLTERRTIQAWKVIPLVVYRVWADGRPDELVRGADLVGTPLASFAKIAAASNPVGVFNGYCGAESGSVPVAAVSPALLVTELEIQKKPAGQDRPPLLPPPLEPGGK